MVLVLAASTTLQLGCGYVRAQRARQDEAALATARNTAKYRMTCDDVTADQLSRRDGWYMNYTIGVKGCGRSDVYPVRCQEQNCEVELDLLESRTPGSPAAGGEPSPR